MKDILDQAQQFGKEASERGVLAAPSLDNRLIKMLVGLKVGESMPLLKAWMKGWTSANLEKEI